MIFYNIQKYMRITNVNHERVCVSCAFIERYEIKIVSYESYDLIFKKNGKYLKNNEYIYMVFYNFF